MRACALTYRELQCEFVSNPTAPTSQRERKFWDRQMGVKRRNERLELGHHAFRMHS
jgi:hypothetical protein